VVGRSRKQEADLLARKLRVLLKEAVYIDSHAQRNSSPITSSNLNAYQPQHCTARALALHLITVN
jgi:hypothetical protein